MMVIELVRFGYEGEVNIVDDDIRAVSDCCLC